MTKYEIVVGFEETGRIQFFGYPKRHSALNSEAKYYIIHILVLTKPDSVKQVLWASWLMLWYFYLECKCNKDGSMVITKCESDGQCSCKDNIDGLKCSKCKDGYFGFPNCKRNRIQQT